LAVGLLPAGSFGKCKNLTEPLYLQR
jgi:hypothetical protein